MANKMVLCVFGLYQRQAGHWVRVDYYIAMTLAHVPVIVQCQDNGCSFSSILVPSTEKSHYKVSKHSIYDDLGWHMLLDILYFRNRMIISWRRVRTREMMSVQAGLYVCAQPMRDAVIKYRRLSLAGRKPKSTNVCGSSIVLRIVICWIKYCS